MNLVVINVCRVCLKNEQGQSLKSDKDLKEKFTATTSIEISDDDSMPSLICAPCSNRLKIAYEFVQQALTSEKNLKQFLAKVANDFEQLIPSKSDGEAPTSSAVAAENNDDLAMYIEDTTTDSDSIELRSGHVPTENESLPESSDANGTTELSYDLDMPTSSQLIEKAIEDKLVLVNLDKTVEDPDTLVLSLIAAKEESQNSLSYEPVESPLLVEMIDPLDGDGSCIDTELDEQDGTDETRDTQLNEYIDLSNVDYLEDTSLEANFANPTMRTESEDLTKITGIYAPNAREVVLLHNSPPETKTKSFKKLKPPMTVERLRKFERIVCKICDKDFSTRTNLKRHMECHDERKRFSCPYCSKNFTQNGSLKQHIYIHTGEKPYVCNVCGRGFTQSKSLVFHMRRHTGAKPFPCQYCEQKFRQKDALKKHVFTSHLVHSENKEKHFCTICCKYIASKEALRLHMNKHANHHDMLSERTAESTADTNVLDLKAKTHIIDVETTSTAQPDRAKRFQCRQCLKCFALKNSLIRHLEVHGTLKCTTCDENFASTEILQEHIKNEHQGPIEVRIEERAFKCFVCGMLIPNKTQYSKHLKECQRVKVTILKRDRVGDVSEQFAVTVLGTDEQDVMDEHDSFQ